MATITGNTKTASQWTQVASASIPGTTTPLTNQQNYNFSINTSGVIADTADLIYSNTLSFTGTTAQNLDLTTLTDRYGAAINFARVREVRVKCKSTTNGQTLMVGYDTVAAQPATPWTGFLNATGNITIQASTATNDAWFHITGPNTTGYVVGGGSKLLRFTPSATMTADVEIVGCSA